MLRKDRHLYFIITHTHHLHSLRLIFNRVRFSEVAICLCSEKIRSRVGRVAVEN